MDKEFTQLLKKGIPFHWDKVAQAYFDVVKDTLVQMSLMYPPNYQGDYFLYITTIDTTICMVFFQVENRIENPIYYFSCNLNDMKVKYLYIEKLSLAAVEVVQIFLHYILFQKTIVISDCSPMNYILSRQLLGGKY